MNVCGTGVGLFAMVDAKGRGRRTTMTPNVLTSLPGAQPQKAAFSQNT